MDILPLSSSFTEANDVLILVDQKSQKEYIFYGNEKRQMECRYISGQVDVPEEIYDDALDIFVEKVAPRYEESYDCDFAYFSAGAKRIDGNVCYGVEIRTNSPDAEISNMLGIYFVNIDTEVVYWWDYLANNEVYVDVEEYYTCVEILKDEVEPVYSEKYDDEFVYSLKNDEEVIVWINESPFYWFEVGVSTEEDYFHVDDFAVNPQTEEIYWYDIYGLYDCNYHKWNGKISNGYGI